MRVILRIAIAAAVGAGIGSAVRMLFRSSSPAPASASITPSHEPKADAPTGGAALGSPASSSTVTGPLELPPHPTGWVMATGRIVVQMSDGTRRIADHGWIDDGLSDGIAHATPSHVILDGQRMYIRAHRPAVSVVPVEPPPPPVSDMPTPARVVSLGAWRLDEDGVYRIARESSIGGR